MSTDRKPTYKTSEDLRKETLNTSKRVSNVARDDKFKTAKVGLLEIDTAIKYYFDNVIKPFVVLNDNTIKVPTIYGTPERWKSIQRDGFYRDNKRKIMVPLIMYRRSGIDNRRELSRNIDANNPRVYQDFYTRYSKRNRYTPFSALNDELPEKEIYNVIVPNYVTLTYDCIIWTDFVEHMNKLIEAINFSDSSYWGEPDKFKFYTMINNFSTPIELNEGEDRVVRSNFELNLNGYFIPDSIQKALVEKSEKGISITKVVFDIDVDSLEIRPTGSVFR